MRSAKTSTPRQRSTAPGTAGIVVVSLVWFGMVLGVSFLATPAKFLAPSLSLPVALDVGRHTFEVFAWVEIVWCLALAGFVLFRAPTRWAYALAAGPCAIVVLEVAWLLPVLDARVGLIIAGGTPPASSLHLLYIVLDGLKLAALLALGLWSLHHLARAERPEAVQRQAHEARSRFRSGEDTWATHRGAHVFRLDQRRSRQ